MQAPPVENLTALAYTLEMDLNPSHWIHHNPTLMPDVPLSAQLAGHAAAIDTHQQEIHMTADVIASLIAQGAQAAVLATQAQHGTAVAGATKKTQATAWFVTFLGAMLPTLPSVLLNILAPTAVQAGYHATVADGTYEQATQAAATMTQPQLSTQQTNAAQ